MSLAAQHGGGAEGRERGGGGRERGEDRIQRLREELADIDCMDVSLGGMMPR